MDNRFYFGFNTSEERKKRRKAELYSMSEQVSTFFWDEAPQHGLEMREGQQDMSFEIVDALINDQHFAIEAGVGIGKSFGYLVPVLLYSKRMNKPVIIATSTIALQEQLWRDVHTVMPLLGLNRDVILAKGQTHYLCNKRADEYMCDLKADPPDALKEGIKQGYEERKDFPEVLPQGIWDKVNVQRFSMKNCGSCEKKCKYYKVRAALKFTDGVILCNQDFLTQHLMKLRRGQEGLINAAADLLVVDEAHNLDDKVRSATTERFGQGMLFGMIKSAFYELRSFDQSSVSGEKREAESAIIAFYQARERRRIYPWLLSRKAFVKLAGREAGDDSLRAAVYRGLEAGNGTDFAQMRKHVLPDMAQNLRQYPKVEARLRAMLAGIPEKRILVIESGCAGTFPLLLMSLDARVDMRMYTTYPYLVDAYGSRIYTRRYEEKRLFETLTAQENLFVFSDWREDGFYVRPCLNVEIRRQALREMRQMQVE